MVPHHREGEDEDHFTERRKAHWRVSEIGVLIMLLVQLAGLIWGAATLKSGVDAQREILIDVKRTVEIVDGNQRRNEIQDARQEGRIDAIQGMIGELQRQRPVPR